MPTTLRNSVVSLSLFVIGLFLVVVAYLQAGAIPRQAESDFAALVRSYGGGMSHTATFPDTYKTLSAQARMLQNGYLGVGGLLLMTLGGITYARARDEDRRV